MNYNRSLNVFDIYYIIIIIYLYDEISKFDNVAYNFIRNRVAKKDKRTESCSTH